MSSSRDSPEVHHSGQPGNTSTTAGLPDEILCDIFKRVLQMSRRDVPFEESIGYPWLVDSDYPKDVPPEESMLAPLRLSQVCRLWRSLALSFPSLWTEITVLIYKFDSARRDEWFSDAVDTWIERSRISPLSLRVECDTSCLTERGYLHNEVDYEASDDPGPKLEITAHILEKLLDHQNRWRDASFTFIGPDPKILPQLGLVDAPLLESLYIYWGGFTQRHDMTQIDLDISCSPRLSNLHVRSIPRVITGGVSSLRELTLDSWEAPVSRDFDIQQSVLLEIIQDMPNLEVLDIGALHCISDSGIYNSRITLPKLHTLAVQGDDYSTSIVSQLILPGLKRLTWKHCLQDGDVNVYSDMLGRSRASLEYFEFRWTAVVESVFAPFLRLIPSLKTICMEYVALTYDLFEMLSVKESGESRDASSIICPNLEELIIVNNHHKIIMERVSIGPEYAMAELVNFDFE
ncbi:uncharacterized protein FOMMEDRAFT_31167 [Fomitiporia mediterranea MF3/22]|uniref:uncharacterized protein n=1 Tax=Fomitiporia mediterranea (strain MF3/22) TaxID=694068 RepID=UPI0004407EFE|nr:uncharacterized protein FOMMEDRAFT_31167 [Fomitiporia mediterranea MF3/22]EJC99442.1 hypothetical protein FOMMEDRAFT_31167 [Fomitiporia mediterranea MF3/22]